MHAPQRRLAAFAVDLILSLMGTALILTPVANLAEPSLWRVLDPVWLLWAFILILLSVLWNGTTPGKRWCRLKVTGSGCIICRELRRSGWMLVLGLGELIEDATAFEGIGTVALATALIWIGAFLITPWQRGDADFPHNSATGFDVSDST